MTCAELRARLDAYVNGTLSSAETAAFEAHLDTCAACGDFLANAAERPQELNALPRSVEPDADLWPAITGRLAPRRASRRGIPVPAWALAAAAVLLIALSSGATVLLLRSGTHAPVTLSSRLEGVEAEYAAASDDLGRTLENARARLAPETLATIERNLATIDSALAESRRALAKDPANGVLEQLVVAAWRQKLEFLRRAAALSTET
ncbi:MAG TPA: zf-HC2 domain-containing protein [Gemmatimonadales bacterium]|nr:zf-HC2 domain-containing protein [Gemmatimonadales bacterium]